jgi:hypothetical protein
MLIEILSSSKFLMLKKVEKWRIHQDRDHWALACLISEHVLKRNVWEAGEQVHLGTLQTGAHTNMLSPSKQEFGVSKYQQLCENSGEKEPE